MNISPVYARISTPVEKPVENVEKFWFSTTFGFFLLKSSCGKTVYKQMYNPTVKKK